MREIKFRARRITNGEWVYGYLFVGQRAWILQKKMQPDTVGFQPFSPIEVDLETIGQYIDRKDKNGVEIYEGDRTDCGIVEWCECLNWDGGGSMHPGFYFKEKYEHERGELSYHTGFDDDVEVLGNIHENPEPLKEEK